MRRLLLLAAVALAACQPPADKNAPPPATTSTPTSVVAACNDVAPDATKQVQLQTQPLAAAALAEGLDGGPVSPGVYDLTAGNVADGAPMWASPRAVALAVTESGGAVTFNYAAAPAAGDTERWTASFADGPPATLTFSCGRTGATPVTFEAQGANLRLVIPDASGVGSVYYTFARRSA
ncbi:hypothetical protein [Terricaulis sp.]|uniref:hypothetical protein n=1 Tax=Terricaulis sp. TaxID=2768686 RepID=UPI0037840D1E